MCSYRAELGSSDANSLEPMCFGEAQQSGYEVINPSATLRTGPSTRAPTELSRTLGTSDGLNPAAQDKLRVGMTGLSTRLRTGGKAERLLGFKAKTPFEEGLRRTIQWYEQAREKGSLT